MERLLGIQKDELTSCYLKNGIFPLMAMLAEEYPATQKPFTILVCDLDHFKSYNDTYGHLLGDEIIKYFSSSIRLDLYGLENFPFRFGGDEFVIVFPGRRPDEVIPLVNRMRENMRTRACLIKGNQVKLTFSGGMACYPADGKAIEDVMENADKALYEAKRQGRNRVIVFDRIWSESKKRQALIISGTAGLLLAGALAMFGPDLARSAVDAFRQSEFVKGLKAQVNTALHRTTDRIESIRKPVIHVREMPAHVAPYLNEPPRSQDTDRPAIEKHEGLLSTVVLKSGGRLKGTLLSKTEKEIKIKLAVAGEATMTIPRDSIRTIENG